MSLLNELQENKCCTENNPDYTITYSDTDKKKIVNVCVACFESSVQHDKFGKIHIWKEHVKQIICLSCKKNVTDTTGCETCHPKSEEEKT